MQQRLLSFCKILKLNTYIILRVNICFQLRKLKNQLQSNFQKNDKTKVRRRPSNFEKFDACFLPVVYEVDEVSETTSHVILFKSPESENTKRYDPRRHNFE